MRRLVASAALAASLIFNQAHAQGWYGRPPPPYYGQRYYRPPVPAYRPAPAKPSPSGEDWLLGVAVAVGVACLLFCPSGDGGGSGTSQQGSSGGALRPPSDTPERNSSSDGYHVAPIAPLYGTGPGGAFYGNDH